MSAYLLDTGVIIDALNGRQSRSEFLLDLLEREGNVLACCPINIAEVYAGMRPKEEEKTSALLRSLRLFPITFTAAELAGRLKRDHAARGVTLSLTDTLIAAVAIENGLTLITDNIKDFPMKELSLYPRPS
jgi:predicted nucleic acid-binding protein